MYAILQLGYFILLSFYWKIMFKLYLQYSLQRLEHFLITQLGYSFLNIQYPKIRYWWLKHKTVLKPQYLKTPKVTTQHLRLRTLQHSTLKGQCQEICDPFLGIKPLPGLHLNSQNRFHEIFSSLRIYSRKTLSAYSR